MHTHLSSLPINADAGNGLILHHYPMSPFAEKIRRVLAFKKLAWKSVVIPMVMPKPDVEALTGGYRKTPVLQIGADIYCDTALICDVLEQIRPEPTLYPTHHKGVARVMAQWADNTLFWAAMGYSITSKSLPNIFADMTPESGKVFAEDRARMRVAVPRLGPTDAAAAYKSYLRRLANMLEGQPFVLGDSPCVADFATYHPLWFTRHCARVMAGVLDATPAVLAWMDRMAALDSQQPDSLESTQAIDLAARSEPVPLHDTVFQDDHGIPLGTVVTIASDSFGPEPSTGELIAATRMHYTLRRVDLRAGTVHVHFPRIGYMMRAARAA